MSLRRELERHRKSLAEIREIMNSMKTLAYMETRKLLHFIDAQRTVVQSIEAATADLLAFYPDVLPTIEQSQSAYLMLGSERGFCGDFNHTLVARLEQTLLEHEANKPLLISIGHKLNLLLDDDPRVAVMMDGASTADDIMAVLEQLVSELTRLERQQGALTLYGLFHNGDGDVVLKTILPPFPDSPPESSSHAYPPVSNLEPAPLFAELSEHYLFALLHQMLYTSLYAENHNRVTHMEGAVQHLDEEAEHLTQRFNALRQEEITEEIEVILLNSVNLNNNSENKRGR